MYKILFIDEEKDAQDKFWVHHDESILKEKFELILEYPLPTLEEMMERIESIKPDAIITDYLLNEKKIDIQYNVSYTGAQLVENILSRRSLFPCFIITSVDDHATDNSYDVNLVYVKSRELTNESEPNEVPRVRFLERVLKQIIHYKKQLEEHSERVLHLVDARSRRELSHKEELELIELDSFLEKSLDQYASIPTQYKQTSNTKKLSELLTKTDALITLLNNNGADND